MASFPFQGAFVIAGSYADRPGSFEWIKSYVGTPNQVRYTGHAVGEVGDRLQGTWSLVHKHDHGTFDLVLKELR
jgi:hypothetical protein